MWTAWPETTKPQVRQCLTCGSARGQGRGRTADLPLFRRTLVPTELPARADETLQQRHGGAGIGRSGPLLVPGGRWRRADSGSGTVRLTPCAAAAPRGALRSGPSVAAPAAL